MNSTEAPEPAALEVAASKSLRRVWLLATVLVAGVALVSLSPLRSLWQPGAVDELRARIGELGWWAPLAFVGLTALGVTLGAPRVAFAALAGSIFGWLPGMALALLGTLLGCLCTFTYARKLGRTWLQARFGNRLRKFNDAFEHHGIVMNLLLRAAPVGNCHLSNLVLAVSPIPLRAYVIGTLLGILPETVIYALFGSSVAGGMVLRVTAGAMLLLALGLVYYQVARRSGRAAELAQAVRDDGP